MSPGPGRLLPAGALPLQHLTCCESNRNIPFSKFCADFAPYSVGLYLVFPLTVSEGRDLVLFLVLFIYLFDSTRS